MWRITAFLIAILITPSILFAGYIFHEEIDSDGQKSRIVLWVDGNNKRMDLYVSGQLHASMISNSGRKTPLYVMHDSETYMNKLPAPDIPTEFPQMEWEPTKQPVNPAEKAVDAMDRAEKTQQRIEGFKSAPWDTAYDTMTDVQSDMQDYQNKQMMKKQMEQIKQMQKNMKSQMEDQMKQMKGRMDKNKRLKNSIKISDFKVTPSSKSKKIGGYKSKLVEVFYKGAHYQDAWVAGDLGKDASTAMMAFGRDDKINGEDLKAYYKTISDLNSKIFVHGFPVLIETTYDDTTRVLYGSVYDAAAPKKVTVKLQKFEKKKINESEFLPPKKYKEVNL